MIDGDALTGLDEVPWADLTHAHGSARDVPELLRALRSPHTRERALHRLYGNIFHQGERYPAAAPAASFLARLALDAATPRRDAVVRLLNVLAIGYDHDLLPAGVDVAGWRAELDRMRAADPAEERRRLDAWVEAAEHEDERARRARCRDGYDHDAELRCLQTGLDVYDAVRAEVPALRGLLGDPDPLTRSATACLLGWFPEDAAESVAALRALLDRESETVILANAIVSAGLLGAAELAPRLRDHLGGEPLLSWAAATALANLGGTGPEVVRALEAALAEPPVRPGLTDAELEVGFMDGSVVSYAKATLATLTAVRQTDECGRAHGTL